MFKDKANISLVVAFIVILLGAYLRPDKQYVKSGGIFLDEKFWSQKAKNPNKYDMLVAGDSRTLEGIQPSLMDAQLKDWQIFNLSFTGCQLNKDLFALINNNLNLKSEKKTLLIGITPRSLLGLTNWNIITEAKRTHSAYIERVYVNPQLTCFLPFDRNYFDGKAFLITKYAEDGWNMIEKDKNDTLSQFHTYEVLLKDNHVKEDAESNLVAQLSAWKHMGIRVFLFRPPVSPAILQLENSKSGFNEDKLKKKTESVGCVWIPINIYDYHSIDGSHVDDTSSIKLSRYIANYIATDQR